MMSAPSLADVLSQAFLEKIVVIYINLDSKISLLYLLDLNQFEHLYLTNEHCFSY